MTRRQAFSAGWDVGGAGCFLVAAGWASDAGWTWLALLLWFLAGWTGWSAYRGWKKAGAADRREFDSLRIGRDDRTDLHVTITAGTGRIFWNAHTVAAGGGSGKRT